MAFVSVGYQLLFLYVEPLSVLVGAFYAAVRPSYYLDQIHIPSAPSVLLAQVSSDPFDPTVLAGAVPLGTETALRQLGSVYLLLALNEFLILRFTSDLRVWRMLLLTMLIGDFGHLWACRGLGSEYYWQWWAWNAMGWGNIAFVYLLAIARIAFLLNVGVNRSSSRTGGSNHISTPERRSGGKSKLR